MANVLNTDFTEFILSLNKANVEYVLVGGYAVIFHGYQRTTGDLDIWINPTEDNYTNLKKAFADFGMSLFDMTIERFLDTENYDVFTFGRPPVCIEILTAVKGLRFNDTYSNASIVTFDGVPIRMIDLRDLIAAKKASNRLKDKDDLEHLEK
ncbi:MAG: nucleotidyltransferase [Chitinophagales bacterium]|nr:nucleotidyltransferase [Chitinophagales bacterium]